MPQYPSIIDLSTLNGANGFRLDGIDAIDYSGQAVAGAGDVNGDGFDDLIIGASSADPGGDSAAGETYVVFGAASGWTAAFDLSTLNGSNGFRLDGIDANDFSGHSVASAGDLNGDGLADLIVGAYVGDPGGDNAAGETYVVFGAASGWSAAFDLSTLNGSNGFRLDGIDGSDNAGFSVASAGDVNGDGFSDLIIGARFADPGGNSNAGETYVVFGAASGWSGVFDLSTLNGSNGFRLDGIDPNDMSGRCVASASDVNGDGFADLIIGAYGAGGNTGEAYVVFGAASGWSAAFDLSTLNGVNGFQLNGIDADDLFGLTVASAGDVNSDGFDDLVVGAANADPGGDSKAWETYVVFGAASGWSATLDLSTLNGSNGFRLDGIDAGDQSGRSVASAGDVNGDGFADLIIGASSADPGGDSFAGEAYVVFGGASGWSATLDLSTLDGNNGFRLDGIDAFDNSGYSVASAGDVNGDGFGDLLIGAFGGDPGGDESAGETYVVFGSAPGEVVTRTGTDIANVIRGGAFDDTLNGLGGSDTLHGAAGADLLDGGLGADAMSGGSGNDTYVVDDAFDTVTESAEDGADTVQSSISYILGANVENLTLTGVGNIDGTGNALSNVINGNSGANTLDGSLGDDVLDGGEGADAMFGGSGDDVFVVDDVGDAVTESSDEGTDTVQSSISYTLGANVENLTLTGAANFNGTGNTLNNSITGNIGDNTLDGGSGNDTLNGAAGADTMLGGLGDDNYVVDNAGDVVTENAIEGTDTAQSSITYSLGSDVENLTLTGSGNIDGDGNALDNLMVGNDGDNRIYGLAGADTIAGGQGADDLHGWAGGDILNGGGGNDTLDGGLDSDELYGDDGDDLLLARAGADSAYGGVGNDALYGGDGADYLHGGDGADVIDGGNGDDIIVGDDSVETGADVLYGRAGNDTLDGMSGADQMYGGAGDDTYLVDDAGDVVAESAGAGTDTVLSSVTRSLGAYIENLLLTGASAINGTGNILANVITGNGASNVLSGQAGFDTLNGDVGNDTLNGGDGNDTLNGGADDDLLDGGNDQDTLNGGDGADTLYGRSAADLLNGDAGSDTLYGGDGDDFVDGGADADLLDGGNGIDTMSGGDGADTLYGRNGNDVLDGGLGTDTLYGGNDADTFVFSTALGGGNIDTVGFSVIENDLIQLDVDVFTAIGLGTLAANAFVIGAAATTADHRIIYDATTGALYYDADGDGAGAAVQFATLGTALAITNADFVGGP